MTRLGQRLQALEAKAPRGSLRWLRLIVPVGQTKESARAAYEAEHGPVSDGVGLIYRVIVAPKHRGDTV